ncbi:MAG: DNA mismatch repair endonuclease MutL [Phycisphaerales bacterium]|nr:DNA mismatch repair endonuclease MutL [Phycisphaerales bacterium]
MSTTQSIVQIRKLSPLLVNQIAAGEVIERPASVLKELVENSIDAGATRITVELELGGIERISIADDGHGIAPDQMTLALTAHATSKIRESEDLNRIGTMGFRGEALASIASISRLSITSRSIDSDEGRIIQAEGDVVSEPKPIGCPVGTTIEVKNLFFNTPARRKFLRTSTTEQTRCLEWLRDLAMANPAIGVRCVGDGKVKLDLPINQTPRQRVVSILGKELEEQLIEVSVDQFDDTRGILVWGLVGLPAIARATSKAQHIFLNGRTIRDRTISHAIREAYRGLIEPGKHPTAVLMIEMSPTAVDVNVHPAKLEVRFRDQSMVHRAIYHGVKDALGRADVTPTLLQRLPGAGFDSGSAIMPSATPAQISQQLDRQVDKLVEYLEAKPQTSGNSQPSSYRQELKEVLAQSPMASFAPKMPSFAPTINQQIGELPTVQRVDKVLQVHSSYLISQDEHGVLIIDQHALHERVMFNKLLTRVTGNGSLEQQALLMPIVLDVPSTVIDKFDELDPLLERIGVQCAPMGPKSVGIHAVPSFLHSRNVEAEPFLRELFEKIDQGGFVPTSEEALHEILDMMSCKAAIKAGDVLSDDELNAIMALRETTERAASCPHGRPTTVRLTIEELEKLFDRR